MNKLPYLLFPSVFLLDFLHFDLGVIPRFATWLPEVLAITAFVVVALSFGVNKRHNIQPQYIVLIALYFTAMLVSTIFNRPPAGAIFVGIRVYCKHLPFFLLPAVYDFSDEQLRRQLRFLYLLLMLQCPVSLYQRVFQYGWMASGDRVTGTLSYSGILSVTLVCSFAVILSLYLTKRVRLTFFFTTMFCLLLPTTLNETKITLVILPVAVGLPLFLWEASGWTKVKYVLPALITGVLFISAFAFIYDYIKPHYRTAPGIYEFFREEQHLRKYFHKEADGESHENIGRMDAVVLTWEVLGKDLKTLAFGCGMGNITGSFFNSFSGERTEAWQRGGEALTLTYLFWELGLFGVVVYISFFVFLFRDALLLRKYHDTFGSVALGWSAVIAMIGLSLVYFNILHLNVINFIFWYFSGLVAARTYRMRKLSRKNGGQCANGTHLVQTAITLPNVHIAGR